MPIDLACTIGGRLFAFEHTGIEPFPDQIKMAVHNRRLFGPIEHELASTLQFAESFELHVPVDATVGLKPAQIAQIQDVLVKWVRESAPTLPIAPYGRYVTPIQKVTLTGVPFAVTLHRFAVLGPRRRFSVAYLVESNIEAARFDRISKSCDDKYGKLAAWKRNCDACTVLVLEEDDIQLTNHDLVAEALSRAEKGRTDAPDEIYVVSTCCDDVWWVTCLRRDGKPAYDDSERYLECDPSTLVQLTDR
ncbi:hypothetical protein C0Z16_20895 [Paraburkholderia rhynchosiae]|uniref:Uncharacterized protein n=1 Tax=Paraburkholderia rhynchosiae TaxID=487049 RepID=A0ABX4V4B3_9BURK|nr:hypothetical protein C0Z16_20895 [Paraburkholderia rhynchosiae]